MKRKNPCVVVRFCGNAFLQQLNPTSEPKRLRNQVNNSVSTVKQKACLCNSDKNVL